MYKVTCGPTAFFDVDDTLLLWDIPEGCEYTITVSCRGFSELLAPNTYNIELLKKFATRGHSVVVWSAGGSDWAEAAVKALNLEKYVEVCTSKPNYYIDDIANPKEWIGKHGFFTYEGKRIHGDNIPNLQINKEKE